MLTIWDRSSTRRILRDVLLFEAAAEPLWLARADTKPNSQNKTRWFDAPFWSCRIHIRSLPYFTVQVDQTGLSVTVANVQITLGLWPSNQISRFCDVQN